MIKKEAFELISKLERERTNTKHDGREILGFIAAPLNMDNERKLLIANRYLSTHNYQDYIGWISDPGLQVEIYVILDSDDTNENPFDVILWEY